MFKEAQNFVHGSGCTLVLPGLLLLASGALLAYRQMTEERTDQPLNGFLANIMLQMLPLVALKAKIWSCTDRVSLVPLVLVRTLLMHVMLGIFRVASQVLIGLQSANKASVTVDFILTVSAIAILHYAFEFPLTFKSLWHQYDVRNLGLLATGAAILSEGFFCFCATVLFERGITPIRSGKPGTFQGVFCRVQLHRHCGVHAGGVEAVPGRQ